MFPIAFAENPPQPSSNHTNGDATSEWSAVGHAAATGKSGRVIHNLQEEIARLKRECSVYRARAEETQRMNEVFKTQVQNMTDQLRNLELANEMNRNSIQRKDNKIEGLKAELQGEKNRRQQAEGETSRTHQEMTDRRDEFDHKTAELTDIANHARTQYDVLAQSSQRDRADLQRRFQVIRSDIASLKDISGKKDVRLERLDTIMAQKNREIDNSRESFDKLFGDYTAYKQAHDDEVRGMVERGRHHDERLDAALASLKETEGRMRWVMQQDAIQRHKTERGAA